MDVVCYSSLEYSITVPRIIMDPRTAKQFLEVTSLENSQEFSPIQTGPVYYLPGNGRSVGMAALSSSDHT